MSSLFLMEQEINSLENGITSKQNELKDLEDSYGSLLQFKTKVENDFNSFSDAKRWKESALSQLPNITSKNTVAEKHSDGMNDLLERKGNLISSNVFQKVLDNISQHLRSLSSKITDCESAISKAQSRLETQKTEYRKEKEKQEEEKNQ
ncbi:MAG: hypothetical protein E7517_00070 [Ruminococcaceae bacterium]|nr:hypothetical protein [Oscillospiraceae bacterium]